MSQKISQPGLQGSPWASGETGSSSTGERMRCVSSGAFWRSSKKQTRPLRIRSLEDETLQGHQGGEVTGAVCDWMRQGLPCFDL